ncbi:uridine kinase family protein [Nocardioides sp. GXZ039]|uniref:uridine kinase family protein n=1 Tax=Nocardioides sp. GXZ039 TaxID=3136018 RepID=UPI0030F413FD
MLDLLAARPASLGTGRLVCIDGPGGSGKTSLAADLRRATGAPVVHMDDLYDGWDGLDEVDDALGPLLTPLARGRSGHYRRYDWHRAAFAEQVAVPPSDLLLVEGVGSGAPAFADLITVLVWVEARHDVRLQRGLARDGEHLRDQWLRWQAAERRHFATRRTRERADVVVDGEAAIG